MLQVSTNKINFRNINGIYFACFLDKDVDKELTKVQELIKANIQRSKVIQDQVIALIR